MVSRELEAESVVVFDEAHNIDNVCTEALSVDLDKRSLDAASRCLGKISSKVFTCANRHARRCCSSRCIGRYRPRLLHELDRVRCSCRPSCLKPKIRNRLRNTTRDKRRGAL